METVLARPSSSLPRHGSYKHYTFPTVITKPKEAGAYFAFPLRVAGWVDPDTAGKVLHPVPKTALDNECGLPVCPRQGSSPVTRVTLKERRPLGHRDTCQPQRLLRTDIMYLSRTVLARSSFHLIAVKNIWTRLALGLAPALAFVAGISCLYFKSHVVCRYLTNSQVAVWCALGFVLFLSVYCVYDIKQLIVFWLVCRIRNNRSFLRHSSVHLIYRLNPNEHYTRPVYTPLLIRLIRQLSRKAILHLSFVWRRYQINLLFPRGSRGESMSSNWSLVWG